MTTVRTRLGLSPDLEEGTKRQKHGDVLFLRLPACCEDLPMSRVLSLVLTAMVRSRVQFPDTFLEAWAGLGVLAQADGVPCFIEDLVEAAVCTNLPLPPSGTRGWSPPGVWARSSSGRPLIRSLTRLMEPMRRQPPRPLSTCGRPHLAMEPVH